MLFIGRLVELKGISNLLRSWKDTLNTNPEISLLIIGDGPEKNELLKFKKKNQLNNVHFAGEVDYDKIYQYLAIADAFIIPTLQDNWSLVVPEAMACGLPIISSELNGCWPELVTPENGWVFNPLNKNDFDTTLLTAWKQNENWDTMGKNSQKLVQQFSPENTAQKIFNACNQLTQ